MRKARHTLARFEEHSLALFAALVMGSTGVAAQVPAPTAPIEEHLLNAQAFEPASLPKPRSSRSADQAFGRADINNDGQLSHEEAQRLPAVADRFDAIDSNHDRVLSRDEFLRGVAN